MVTDEAEMNKMFQAHEKTEICNFHNSHLKAIPFNNHKDVVFDANDVYQVIDTDLYDGTINHEIVKISFVAYTDSGTTYVLRVSDREGNVVATTMGLTNTDNQITTIETINYQPTTAKLLDIDIKRTAGTGKVYYSSAILHYL